MGFYAYGVVVVAGVAVMVRWVVAVVVGCCCGGEVEGMGLWIGMVEV